MTATSRKARPNGNLHRDLRQQATPRPLKNAPIHRWFYFPHSYGPGLVEAVLDHWQLPRGSRVLDPFVGSGTTLVVAAQRGIEALGLDISPLAVLASNVKTRTYKPKELRAALEAIVDRSKHAQPSIAVVAPRLRRAFSTGELRHVMSLRDAIASEPKRRRDFFLLALLASAAPFSRAVPDGGWFRWVEARSRAAAILPAFRDQAELMISDAEITSGTLGASAHARRTDALMAAEPRVKFDAVITSPPYANRHDYTRVFHIQLLLLGLSEDQITRLRKHSMRSHVEAKAPRQRRNGYEAPAKLTRLMARWPSKSDARVPRMLLGYFEDLHDSLVAVRRALRPGGRAAFVLGNVRHAGILVPVDTICVEIAESVGFRHEGTRTIRVRGNSAQQMARFGKKPARESIIMLARE